MSGGRSIATILGCLSMMLIGSVMAEETSDLYESGFRQILEGNYRDAYDRFGEVVERSPGTSYARLATERRTRLEALSLPSIRRPHIDQSGRIESVVFSTLYATWLGVGTARLLDPEDNEKAIAAGMMIGAPVGLVSSLALTRNARLSDGQAALVNFSGYWGTWQGYGWSSLLDAEDDDRTLIASAMAGGLLGLATTSIATRSHDLTVGAAGLINYGALWGSWFSLCAAAIAEFDDGDDYLTLVLVGGNLGAAAMAAVAPKTDVSLGRASLINLSGIVGTLATGGMLLMAQPDSAQVVFGGLSLGGAIGLAAGVSRTEGMGSEVALQRVFPLAPHQYAPQSPSLANRTVLGSAPSSQGIRANLLHMHF